MFYGLNNIIKKILPKGLFYRSLIIVATPIILLQIIITIVFFDSLWIKANKGMTRSLVSEVKTLFDIYNNDQTDKETILDLYNKNFDFVVRLKENEILLSKDKVDVLVIGHGSMDPNAGISINYIVDELRKTYKNVDRCYLEIEEPNIEQGIQSCQNNNPDVLVIVFYFLHEGAHVKTDINNDLKPALEKSNLKKVCVTKHLGADEKMIDLIVERAKEVENAN